MNELNAYQIGIVLMNFLISVFAEACELHDFIFKGARFQALTPSLMKVFFESSGNFAAQNTQLVYLSFIEENYLI